MSEQAVYILVGPEDALRLSDIQKQASPRLDYRVVAERVNGIVNPFGPSPAVLKGAKIYRLTRSFKANFSASLKFVKSLPYNSIIYSTGETWGLPVSLALRFFRRSDCKHLIYLHRVYSPRWQKLLKILEPTMYVDGWVCVTQSQVRLLQQTFRHKQVINVVSQGVDTLFFNPRFVQERDKFILSVGSEMRNYPLLMQVAEYLDVKVLVKASSSWMTGGREDIGKIPKNVTFITQYLSFIELRRLYAESVLVIVPLHDTLQAAGITTILEAMAMRKPVIATNSRGNPDILVSGVNGLVVEPYIQSIISTIESLIDDTEYRRELSSRAWQDACSEVSLDNHATQIEKLISSF